MLDERLERVRRGLETPPWDELRETRVLGSVLEEVRHGRRRRRKAMLATSAVGAAVAVAAATLLMLAPEQPEPTEIAERAPASAPPTVEEPSAPAGSVLTLSDGSRAELSPNAAVQALEQSGSRVAVRQSRGQVRYDVTERPERDFVVHAGDVEVRVLGTIFSVELLEDGVQVSVERGRVALSDRNRRVELTRGESMFLAEGAELAEPEVQEPSPAAKQPRRKARKRARTATASAGELLAQADAARQAGRLGQAAQALTTLTRQHARDPRAISAWFTLGRVQGDRGRFEASARAFERCFERSPSGTLAEDALAESARAWAAAGRDARASASASRYLSRYPGGTHATRMRSLSQR